MARNRISVVIDVVADRANKSLKDFKKSVAEADGAFGKLKAGGKSAMAGLKANAAVVGPAIGAAFLKGAQVAINAASDLAESINAVNVTFGEAAEGIHKLGESSVESFGLSQNAFNNAAVQFSAFAKQVAGPGGDVVATMRRLIGRVTDFASVMNTDLNTAMQVFQSTLAGQTEPIRRYGKDVSAAAVELYALENGLAASKKEMTEAVKVQARYGLLMEQTADTAGDFANTSDSLANQQKILAAQMEDLAAQIGTHLVPAVADAVEQLNNLIEVGAKLGDTADDVPGLTKAFNALQESVELTVNPFGKLYEATQDWNEESKDAVKGLAEMSVELDGVAQGTNDLGKELVTGVEAAGALGKSFAEMAAETQSVASSQDFATKAIRDHHEAMEEAIPVIAANEEALRELTNAQIEAAGETLDLEEATLRLEGSYAQFLEAQTEHLELMGEAKTTDEEKAQSTRDLRLEQIDLAKEIFATTQQRVEELGATEGSTAAIQVQIGELLRMKARYPELATEIDGYVGKLGEIPDVIPTDIQALIDQGKLAEAEAALTYLARRRKVLLTISKVPTFSGDADPRPSGRSHTGTRFAAGQTRNVLSNQAFIPDRGQFTAPTAGQMMSQTRTNQLDGPATGGGITVVIPIEGNVYGVPDPSFVDSLAEQIEQRLAGLK